jgi:polyisoprenoid-binding protein YceI
MTSSRFIFARHRLISGVASLAFVGLSFLPSAAEAKKFDLDGNHTSITFRASTVLFDVDGRFDKYKLSIDGDPAALGAITVKLDIEAGSINTNNKTRDEHLRSPDFFDAKKFPKLSFVGTSAAKEGDKIVVAGTLEIHGVKNEVKIPFTPVVAKNGAGVEEHVYKGELTLHRKDFGVGADSLAAKISLADEVPVKLLIAGFFP